MIAIQPYSLLYQEGRYLVQLRCPYCRVEVRADVFEVVTECHACELEIVVATLDVLGIAYGSA